MPEPSPGVYIISTPKPLRDAPIDAGILKAWLGARPEMRVDGVSATVAALDARLRAFWIAGQPIVYIGLAGGSLRKRLADYYRTPLGARAPHAGGHWLKTLSVLSDLRVTWATADDPDTAEDALLRAFGAGVSAAVRRAVPRGPILPFANLQTGDKVRKAHGITGSKAPRSMRTSPPRVRSTTSNSRTLPRNTRDLVAINAAIQALACSLPERRAWAGAAAEALDQAGLLRDSESRRGKPLRDLLRDGLIDHAYQGGGRFWFIDCADT